MDTQAPLDLGGPALKTRQAARYLGVSVSLLNKLFAAGEGPVAHVYGRRRVYKLADLNVYAAAHRVERTTIATSNQGGQA